MKKNNLPVRAVSYVLGLMIMTIGIAISKRSCLGVSPVSTVPYTITGITGIDVGITTVIFHSALVLIQLLMLGKQFKIKSLLQVPVGVLFGFFTSAFQKLMFAILPDPTEFSPVAHYTVSGIMCFVSTVLIALGIFFYVPANIIPLAGEGVTAALSEKAKIKFSNSKIIFDVTMVSGSFISCCIAAGGLKAGYGMDVVGIGTIAAAVLVGVNLKWITKLLSRFRDRILKPGKEAQAEESSAD